jgi:SPIRAL1-like protein
LGYLFGSTETDQPKPAARAPVQPPQPTVAEQRPAGLARAPPPEEKPALAPAKAGDDGGASLDMGGHNKMGRNSNNYHRADGQNTGNFITVSFLNIIQNMLCILPLYFQRPDNVIGHSLVILSPAWLLKRASSLVPIPSPGS